MKVSVITVSYNAVDTIEDTIRSVISQVGVDLEYIVVDGLSYDGTAEILSENVEKISSLIVEKDDGMYDALNKGLKECSGDIIAILNADDVFLSQFILKEVVETFREKPGLDLLLGGVDIFDIKSQSIVRRVSVRFWSAWMLRFGWMPPHPGMFVRRRLYESIGGFDATYAIAADYEFSIRALLRHSTRYGKLGKQVVRMAHGGMSTSNFAANRTITNEIMRACIQNGYWSAGVLIYMRLPFKVIVEMVIPRFLSLWRS